MKVRFEATNFFAEALALEGCYRPRTEDDVAILEVTEPLPDGASARIPWLSPMARPSSGKAPRPMRTWL